MCSMNVLSMLSVRFHFNGEFINDGEKVHYVGGREAMSYIDRDKVSLQEIIRHLRDHYTVEDGALVHWLFPGKDLDDGHHVLMDDKTCLQMADAIVEGGVAEIYVEAVAAADESSDKGGQGREIEDELMAITDVDSADGEGGHGDAEGDGQGDADDDDVAGEDAAILKPDFTEVVERQIKKLQEFYRSPVRKRRTHK